MLGWTIFLWKISDNFCEASLQWQKNKWAGTWKRFLNETTHPKCWWNNFAKFRVYCWPSLMSYGLCSQCLLKNQASTSSKIFGLPSGAHLEAFPEHFFLAILLELATRCICRISVIGTGWVYQLEDFLRFPEQRFKKTSCYILQIPQSAGLSQQFWVLVDRASNA